MDRNVDNSGETNGLENHEFGIIQECLSGNSQSFEKLVDLYQKPVYNLVYRYLRNTEDARDITQETFVKAYRALKQYNPVYPFRVWIYRIARNLSIDKIRRDKKYSQTGSLTVPAKPDSDDSEDIIGLDITDPNPDARIILMEKEKACYIDKIINSLPEPYKTAIILRYKDEISLDEISRVMEIPVGTVKTYLYRGRNILKSKLEKIL